MSGNENVKEETVFEDIVTAKKYYKYKECEEGQILVNEGEYLGTTPNKFNHNHDFREASGQIVSLNSAGQLNYIMDNHIEVGDVVRVVYDGTSVLEKGAFEGKEVHNFKVQKAKSAIQHKGDTGVTPNHKESTVNLNDLV